MINTQKIILSKEQKEVLALRLRKRLFARMLLMTCIAIAQRVLSSNETAEVITLTLFTILAISFVQAVLTYVNFINNKITFKVINKRYKKFYDKGILNSKVEGATHYFKETILCKILVRLGEDDEK